MRYWTLARLCTFALTVSNLAAPAPCRPGLILIGMRLRPVNAEDGRMSAIASHSPSLPASGTLGMRFFARAGQRAFTTIRAWQTRMRQRRELLMLNEVELRELSLTEADVNRATSKPCWESIGLTGR